MKKKIDIGNALYYAVFIVSMYMGVFNIPKTKDGLLIGMLFAIAICVFAYVNDALLSKVFNEEKKC